MAPSTRHPGQWVDPEVPRTRAGDSRESWSNLRALRPGPESSGRAGRPSGPQTCARVTQDSWSTPRVFRQWPESRGTAGRHRGPSDPSAIRPGDLVDTASPSTRARVARTPGQTREAVGTLTSCQGQLVHYGGTRTRAIDARDACSTPRYLRRGPESPRTTGRPQALGH